MSDKIKYITFIFLSFVSLAGFIIASTKNLSDEYLAGEYEMSLRVLRGENPYKQGVGAGELYYPYNIGNYIINIFGLSFYHHPATLKLVRSISGWLIGIVIFVFYFSKSAKEAMLRASVYFLTYHFVLAFAFFGINEPYVLLFVILGLIFFIRKNQGLGIIAYLIAVSIKQFTLVLLPFLVIYIWKEKHKKKLYTLLAVGCLMVVILPFLLPGYLHTLVKNTDSGFANRYDNIYLLGGSILPFLFDIKLNEFSLLLNKLLFFFVYIFFLVKFFLKKEKNIYSAYFIPIILWLLIPPNAYLWGNYYFWLSIPILLTPLSNSILIYSLLLLPEYLLKMANSGLRNFQVPMYLFTEIVAIVVLIYLLKLFWNYKESRLKSQSAKSVLAFIALQATLILMVGLARGNLLWFM